MKWANSRRQGGFACPMDDGDLPVHAFFFDGAHDSLIARIDVCSANALLLETPHQLRSFAPIQTEAVEELFAVRVEVIVFDAFLNHFIERLMLRLDHERACQINPLKAEEPVLRMQVCIVSVGGCDLDDGRA